MSETPQQSLERRDSTQSSEASVTKDARRDANRQNARKSTGPKTVAGRARSARNATRHGLLSNEVVVFSVESEDGWRKHRNATIEAVGATSYVDVLLAERLALDLWRLARLARHEAALWEHQPIAAKAQHAVRAAIESLNPDRELLSAFAIDEQTLEEDPFLELCPSAAELEKLARYEAHLERSVLRILKRLEAAEPRNGATDAKDE